MRKSFTLILILFSLFFYSCHFDSDSKEGGSSTKGIISISGAFALYPITVKWAEEYKKLHPGIRIDISAGGAGKGMTDALSKMVDIGLVSREIYDEEIKNGAWSIAVTKDAVLPTISALHPQLNEILSKGITKKTLEDIYITGSCKTWAQAGIQSQLHLHTYTRSDAAGAAESWAKYFGRKQEDLKGIGVFGDPGVAQAVQKDPAGIGYNNMIYIYDPQTKKQTNGVRVLPIDFNNNGKIDPEENFYDSMDDIANAIASGKYPSPAARDLYFVSKGKPQNKRVLQFIEWVLTDGQKYVHDAGYINLSKESIDASLEKLK